ncbi:MAG TPA: hypothetical protein QF564_15710 [Pirellulaceae bacterium]|nr:hypothetical protein [Pirellulaceae bacterium]
MHLERDIENVLVDNVSSLGYPDAVAIRNVNLVPRTGRADVILLPREGLHRLVVIEVKRADAPQAAADVVGQLMKYYSQALTLGIDGLERLREYGEANPEEATGTNRTTPNSVFDEAKNREARERKLREGRALHPKEVALFIALNGKPQDVLKQIITVLDVHHALPIGVIRIDDDSVRVLAGADVTSKMR